MRLTFHHFIIAISILLYFQCKSQTNTSDTVVEVIEEDIRIVEPEPALLPEKIKTVQVGAAQPEIYLPLLKGKRVGVITNQTGVIKISDTGKITDTVDYDIHIVDYLISNNVKVKTIFAPEHGFRGKADAGETIKDGIDVKTNLPIISLYGKNKKPYKSQIANLDVLVFDIQDVGARFYTYISTLHYVMEAAAENGKKVIVLDRPNPNAHYVDGPIMEPKYVSFVGLHPVPIVYGMTIGEYAKMINGEKWLKNGVKCNLEIIPITNYTHDMPYSLPIKPSPNLPNDVSINLYPSTCFFEGANVSEGRGTEKQFQVYGSPYLKNMDFKFTPKPNEGAKNPRFNGKVCYGEDLSTTKRLSEIKLDWLINAYKNNTKQPFWIKNSGQLWIDKLAGTDQLRKQIDAGKSAKEIKVSWEPGLQKFKVTRSKYLIYN